jgi:hypothetical protein
MDRSVDLRALLPLVRGLTILVVDDDEFDGTPHGCSSKTLASTF